MTRFTRSLILLVFAVATAYGAAPPPTPPPTVPQGAPQTAPGSQTPPLTILSIIPSQGEPGITITLGGSGFTDDTLVYLAASEIKPVIKNPRLLSFEIPDIPAGLYALYLKRNDGATSRAYSFTIAALRPFASELSADTITACAPTAEREVTLYGRNFRPGAQLLFDGAAIRSRRISPEEILFSVPQVQGGLHQVHVRNPDGSASGSLALMVDAKPEISGVTTGEEFVNYYYLNIDGRNFQQGSTVVIMEESSLEQMGQLSVNVRRLNSGGGYGGGERDRVIYVNCTRIMYQRSPYSNVPKNFSVQVLNPDGSESSIMPVSAP